MERDYHLGFWACIAGIALHAYAKQNPRLPWRVRLAQIATPLALTFGATDPMSEYWHVHRTLMGIMIMSSSWLLLDTAIVLASDPRLLRKIIVAALARVFGLQIKDDQRPKEGDEE